MYVKNHHNGHKKTVKLLFVCENNSNFASSKQGYREASRQILNIESFERNTEGKNTGDSNSKVKIEDDNKQKVKIEDNNT